MPRILTSFTNPATGGNLSNKAYMVVAPPIVTVKDDDSLVVGWSYKIWGSETNKNDGRKPIATANGTWEDKPAVTHLATEAEAQADPENVTEGVTVIEDSPAITIVADNFNSTVIDAEGMNAWKKTYELILADPAFTGTNV